MELAPTNRLTATLLDDGWGRSWGVFLKIRDPANLRHHLRKFLKVRDEQGRKLLFRYYDPRVLRIFLPTVDAEQCAEVFGPIAAWLPEDSAGGLILRTAVDRMRTPGKPALARV